jgi:hypothetical protein
VFNATKINPAERTLDFMSMNKYNWQKDYLTFNYLPDQDSSNDYWQRKVIKQHKSVQLYNSFSDKITMIANP